MGWQDRDYAKLHEGELDELYGIRTPKTVSTRRTVWTIVALLVVATAGFAYTQRQTASPRAFTRTPDHVYGTPLSADAGFGPDTYCTDFEFVPASGQWRCDVVAINTDHVPVDRATPYVGSCGHIAVLDTRWVCVDGSAAVPPQTPPAPTAST